MDITDILIFSQSLLKLRLKLKLLRLRERSARPRLTLRLILTIRHMDTDSTDSTIPITTLPQLSS